MVDSIQYIRQKGDFELKSSLYMQFLHSSDLIREAGNYYARTTSKKKKKEKS